MVYLFRRNQSRNKVNTEVLSYKEIYRDYRNQMLRSSSQVDKLMTVLDYTRRLIKNGCINNPDGQFETALSSLNGIFDVLQPDLDYTSPKDVNLPGRVVARLQDVNGVTSMQLIAGNKEWKFGFDSNSEDNVFSYTN
jgi:hypothetical protein